jgi:hypothetical protein
MMLHPPLVNIGEEDRNSYRWGATVQLACGHRVDAPKRKSTKRVRCLGCMPLEDRQAFLRREAAIQRGGR